MGYDRHEVQLIAITMADGSLAVMQFITRAWNDAQKAAALASGDPVAERVREATDDAINLEIARAGFDAVSWRRIQPEDLPATRDDRDAWRDDGEKIGVDPARRKVRPQTLAQRIAALEEAEAGRSTAPL